MRLSSAPGLSWVFAPDIILGVVTPATVTWRGRRSATTFASGSAGLRALLKDHTKGWYEGKRCILGWLRTQRDWRMTVRPAMRKVIQQRQHRCCGHHAPRYRPNPPLEGAHARWRMGARHACRRQQAGARRWRAQSRCVSPRGQASSATPAAPRSGCPRHPRGGYELERLHMVTRWRIQMLEDTAAW